MSRKPVQIDSDDDDLDSVDISPDLARAQEEAARKAAETDDDDDDFDLLGKGEEDEDEDLSYLDDDQDDDQDDEDDDQDDEDDDSTSLTSVPKVARKGKEKPKSKAQIRIEELATKRREAEEASFKAEMDLIKEREARAALEARIAALESGGPTNTTQIPKKPNADDYKYGEVDPEYVNDVIEHRLATERAEFQKEQEEKQGEAERERQKAHYQQRLAKVTAEGNKKFKDFDEIVNRVDFPGAIALEVLDSDFGVDIAYYLGKNIGKLREMTLMSPQERMRAMVRLEERFSARASAAKKRSKAPDTPGRRVKKGKPGADAKYGPDDQDAFDKAFYQR